MVSSTTTDTSSKPNRLSTSAKLKNMAKSKLSRSSSKKKKKMSPFGIVDVVQPRESDVVLAPHDEVDGSAFDGTSLERLLKEEHVETAIVMGFLADKSILETCNDLTDIKGLKVLVCSDGVGASSETHHGATIKRALPTIGVKVINCDEAKTMINTMTRTTVREQRARRLSVPMTEMKMVKNWAESYSVDDRKFRRPENMEALKEIVATEDSIRVAGSMHSCAPLIESEGGE